MDSSKTLQCLLVFTIFVPRSGSMNLLNNKLDGDVFD